LWQDHPLGETPQLYRSRALIVVRQLEFDRFDHVKAVEHLKKRRDSVGGRAALVARHAQ
jgi:hypothetical protein